jgi:hypothetical protein
MIDLAQQHHQRFHLQGLSGSDAVLMTEDPSVLASNQPVSAASIGHAIAGFHSKNERYMSPGMSEASHALISNIDMNLLAAYVLDGRSDRQKAAFGLMSSDAAGPQQEAPQPSMGPRSPRN